jgi:hypothetical protein
VDLKGRFMMLRGMRLGGRKLSGYCSSCWIYSRALEALLYTVRK